MYCLIGADIMTVITIEKENHLLVNVHGLTISELNKIPGELVCTPKGSAWKEVRLKNIQIVFYKEREKRSGSDG